MRTVSRAYRDSKASPIPNCDRRVGQPIDRRLRIGMRVREEDFLVHLFVASTHDYVLFITSEGRAFWLKVHEIPEASRASRGTNVKTLLAISPNEEIATVASRKGCKTGCIGCS